MQRRTTPCSFAKSICRSCSACYHGHNRIVPCRRRETSRLIAGRSTSLRPNQDGSTLADSAGSIATLAASEQAFKRDDVVQDSVVLLPGNRLSLVGAYALRRSGNVPRNAAIGLRPPPLLSSFLGCRALRSGEVTVHPERRRTWGVVGIQAERSGSRRLDSVSPWGTISPSRWNRTLVGPSARFDAVPGPQPQGGIGIEARAMSGCHSNSH